MEMVSYQCKVGVAFFGGCGSNILRLTIDGHNPKEYPDFYLFGANTDALVHKLHFGKPEDPQQKLWVDAGALIIHQLGGDEVTGGRGAGAMKEVGEQAAKTEGSMEAMRKFFESVDEILLVGAVGGGTGTGALPVATRLAAIEMKKTTLALVVTPDPKDGRIMRAADGLAKIQELVPTITISNAYLKEIMSAMTAEERSKLTYSKAWKIVNNNSLVPMLLIIREILQETGEVMNIDEADWKAILEYGHYVFFGLANVDPEKVKDVLAQDIVEELCAARFQDPGLIKNGKVIALWAHGRLKK